ncbi:1,4-beta-glucanase [Pelagibius sp. Alg239-R121]|uniref:1,4-beta-glucanase n=1 Tax=Pelagibius sp. Alg239-R121 TaxID=2993448 RepID=UPI0024A6A7D7|nr:1,4-beta-glucanase [Pelagibius sp. Alg239-R121]
MSRGSYSEFRDALRAFESGWDRERYDNGNIQDFQLDLWAGGSVQEIFPGYSSWSQLSDEEWDSMSYRSMNTLGFVGYQFGEALMIDLGYYDDDVFYGAGATTNTWDGTWTGKNGVNSLEDFMTKEAQEVAIQEAFGFNLKIIQEGLANNGESLDDYIGTTRSYVENGQAVEVPLTLSGIMAAAHLRGAYGTLALLQGGSVSTDEFGTSILRYIEQFGDYDAPSVAEAVAYFESRLTGDEGLGAPGAGGGSSGSGGSDLGGGTDGNGAGVTKETADVVVTWAWGQKQVVTEFDPSSDTIFIDWINAEQLEVSEQNGSAVFAIPSNNQNVILQGVALADLTPSNFTILDGTAATEVFGLIAVDENTEDGSGGDAGQGNGNGHGGGHDGGHGGGNGQGNSGDPAQMVMIGLDSGSRDISDFDPAKDMVHLLEDVTGDRFEMSEEGEGAGKAVRIVITDENGAMISVTTLQAITLADLTLSNFSVAEQTAFNEVVTAINATVSAPPPQGGGFDITDDNDGSSPAKTSGTTEKGGVKYVADVNADDILNFDPAKDQFDFGNNSVHGMILTKTPAGEVAIDFPWSQAIQIVQGVKFADLSIENFGVVGNEHLREDIGGVLSWELGIGPREADTVYIRSHEYGKQEVIDDFDPATMKISFLYFGTREQLSVEDTADGLVIQTLPSGQSFTFAGVELADLSPGQVEFHFDQVIEDNLEVPFGFAQEDVTLVDRTVLLTPEAPPGQGTDGFQTRDGVNAPGGGDSGGGSDGGGVTPQDGGSGSGGTPTSGEGDAEPSDGRIEIAWSWAKQEVVSDFDPATDVFDFGHMAANQVKITEQGDDLVIEVLDNGGHNYTLKDVQAEDLSAANLEAAPYNDVIKADGGVIDQLAPLGFDDMVA